MAHTPGPWGFRRSHDGTGDIGITALGVRNVVAECFAAMRSRDERSPEVEANASLIAAAPDLLAALQEIEEFTRDVPDDEPLSHVCGTARIAIAKAVSP